MDKDEKKYRREYMKKYYHKPDVKAKVKKNREKPEVKKRIKEYNKMYYKKPEVIAHAKERRETPKIKARIKEYYKKPETIKRMKEYYQTPEEKLKRKEYYNKPEIKARIKIQHKEYNKRPETIIRIKKYKEGYLKERRQDAAYVTTLRIKHRVRRITNGKLSLKENQLSAIIRHLQPFPQDLDLHVIHHKVPLNRFTFFNPDGTIIKEDFDKAFAPENHEWMTIEAHKKLDHSKL